jgi:hypothetical protein
MITGQAGPCAGQNKAVERLGIPALCLQGVLCDRCLELTWGC